MCYKRLRRVQGEGAPKNLGPRVDIRRRKRPVGRDRNGGPRGATRGTVTGVRKGCDVVDLGLLRFGSKCWNWGPGVLLVRESQGPKALWTIGAQRTSRADTVSASDRAEPTPPQGAPCTQPPMRSFTTSWKYVGNDFGWPDLSRGEQLEGHSLSMWAASWAGGSP